MASDRDRIAVASHRDVWARVRDREAADGSSAYQKLETGRRTARRESERRHH